MGESMSKNLNQVKVILLVFLFIEGCVTAKLATHKDWLAEPVELSKIDQLRSQLETISKLSLKSRGEAHITVISPPEFNILKSKLSMSEINIIAEHLNIEKAKWTPICVAQANLKNKPNSIVFYIIVKSEELIKIRNEISTSFLKKGGAPAEFDPLHYFPHITIGFTDRDLYEQDGVIKDTRNCVFDLTTEDGRKLTRWNVN
jgi:2'-5' RNA ligase